VKESLRAVAVLPVMAALVLDPAAHASTLPSLAAARGSGHPQHAWWRDLLSWSRAPCASGRGSSHTSRGESSALPVLRPSQHLQWAKCVRTEQQAWYNERHALRCGRLTSSIDSGRCPCSPVACAPTIRSWAWGLRSECSSQPVDWQERKYHARRKKHALRHLRCRQTKWRQRQVESERSCAVGAFSLVPANDGEPLEEDLLENSSASEFGWSSSDEEGVPSKVQHDTPHDVNSHMKSNSASSTSFSTNTPSAVFSPTDGSLPELFALGPGQQSGTSTSLQSSRRSSNNSNLGATFADDIVASAMSSSVADSASRISALSSKRSSVTSFNSAQEGKSRIPEEGADADKLSGEADVTDGASSAKRRSAEFHAAAPSTILDWEDWRVEFRIEALDRAARFFHGCEVIADVHGGESCHARLVALAGFCKLASLVLGAPADAVSEEVCVLGMVFPRSCSSLVEVLQCLRRVAAHLRWQRPDLLCSQAQEHAVQAAWSRWTRGLGSLAVTHLYDVVQEVGFFAFDASKHSEQQWLQDIMRRMTMEETSAQDHRRQKVHPHGGSLSFSSILRMLQLAARERARLHRRKMLVLERQTRSKVGLSLFEMEDLRELHHSYLLLPGANALERLTAMLQRCGATNLTAQETMQLERIIQHQAEPQLDGTTDLGDVPFPTFVHWMAEALDLRIGGLSPLGQHRAAAVGAHIEPRREGSFIATMLQELERARLEAEKHSASSVMDTQDDDLGAPRGREVTGDGDSRKASTARGCSGSSRDSSPAAHMPEPEQVSQRKALKQRQSTYVRPASVSSQASQDASPQPATGRRTAREKLMSVGQDRPNHRGRSRTRISHKSPPRGDSHTSRASSSASGERSEADSVISSPSRLTQNAQERRRPEQPTLVLKGLPSSEVMLSRREVRACSVDLSGQPELRTILAEGADPSDLTVEAAQHRASSWGPAPTGGSSSEQPQAGRKVKQAQASDDVVREAIARLSGHELA